jgi:Phytanoyl-CoA dioxygenase (PhyH)
VPVCGSPSQRTATPAYPTPAFDRLPADSGLPEAGPDDVDPEFVRAAILRNGCVLIRGLISPDEAKSLADEIERAYVARAAHAAGAGDADENYFAPFEPNRKFDLSSERVFSQDAAGLWAADSPHVMFDVLDVFERTGLTRMATGYLGQHPVMSVNKSVLRKVPPDIFGDSGEGDQRPSGWHQDGRFMGSVTALNVWMALCRCGDVVPGLELVPRRLDEIVPHRHRGRHLRLVRVARRRRGVRRRRIDPAPDIRSRRRPALRRVLPPHDRGRLVDAERPLRNRDVVVRTCGVPGPVRATGHLIRQPARGQHLPWSGP